jgi:hypothetical protein
MSTKTPVEKRDYAVRWQHLVNGPIQCTPVRIRILNDFFEAENIYEAYCFFSYKQVFCCIFRGNNIRHLQTLKTMTTTTPDFPMYYLHEGKYKMFPDTFSVIEVGENSIEYKTFLTKIEVCSMVITGRRDHSG